MDSYDGQRAGAARVVRSDHHDGVTPEVNALEQTPHESVRGSKRADVHHRALGRCRKGAVAVRACEVRTFDEHDLSALPEIVWELFHDGIRVEALTERRVGVGHQKMGDGAVDATAAIQETERSLAMQDGCVGSLLVRVGDHGASEAAVLEGLTQFAEDGAVRE